MRLTTPAAFPFRYTSDSAGFESWAFLPLAVATLDQPRTVNDARARVAGTALAVLLQSATQTLLLIEAAALPDELGSIQSYCLKNLLLRASDPLLLIAIVRLDGPGAGDGTVSLQFSLRLALPILPDPYTTNLAFDPRRAIDSAVLGTMTIRAVWTQGDPPALDVRLPADALLGVVAEARSAAVAPPAGNAAPALEADAASLARLQGLFDRAVGIGRAGPTLLDLSTNVSQFGVTLGTESPLGAVAFVGAQAPPFVADLFLEAPASEIRVVALPAVQWGAGVDTQPGDAVPEPPDVRGFRRTGGVRHRQRHPRPGRTAACNRRAACGL